MKIGALKNSAKFTGKHMYQILFYHKVAGLRSETLLKWDSATGVFMWILQDFYEHIFHRKPPGDCFCILKQ